jgi:hypothetical protein
VDNETAHRLAKLEARVKRLEEIENHGPLPADPPALTQHVVSTKPAPEPEHK